MGPWPVVQTMIRGMEEGGRGGQAREMEHRMGLITRGSFVVPPSF